MKFLIDENLPPLLARVFVELGHEALHVSDLGLIGVPDDWIAAFAETHGLTIVTREADFDHRADGALRVLRLEFGDCRTEALVANFSAEAPAAIALLQRQFCVVLKPPA